MHTLVTVMTHFRIIILRIKWAQQIYILISFCYSTIYNVFNCLEFNFFQDFYYAPVSVLRKLIMKINI